MKAKLKIEKRDNQYWVTKIPDCEDVGPYDTRGEAKEHQIGLQRTFDHMDDWSFWTSEPEPKK